MAPRKTQGKKENPSVRPEIERRSLRSNTQATSGSVSLPGPVANKKRPLSPQPQRQNNKKARAGVSTKVTVAKPASQQVSTKQPAARRKPVEIAVDSDHDGETEKSDNEHEQDDDEEMSDPNDDLVQLDRSALKAKIESEQPRWSKPSRRSNSEHPSVQTADKLFDDDGSEEEFEEETEDPLSAGIDMTTDEFDDDARSHSGGSQSEDLGSRKPDVESDMSTNEVDPPRKLSKRDMARLKEVPTWRMDKATRRAYEAQREYNYDAHSTKSHNRSSSQAGDHDKDSVNSRWSEEAHYVPVARGGRTLSLLSQPEPLKKSIRAAVRCVVGDALFVTAYPAVNTSGDLKHHRKVLSDCANRLRYTELAERFKSDDKLVNLCMSLLNTRVANIRTRSKEHTDKKVEGFYQLFAGEECKKQVAEYISSISYIYPNTNGPLSSNKEKRAYFHPAIIASIRDCFFTGKRGTLADKHRGLFKSSIADNKANSKNELELPIPMVAIVATTTHASLDEWSDGIHQDKGDFRAEHYEDVYKGHEMFLEGLRKEKPVYFHRLMADLYQAVSGSKNNNSAARIAQAVMAHLNFDGLDDDDE